MADEKNPPAGPEAPIPIGPVIINRPPPFPIFVNTNPSIQSLSPPAAVVGGGDFTLTVLGSNFGSASTVTWNQAARATAVVSATQLTATIAAADLAAIATASVAVSNQGAPGTPPVYSNAVAFAIVPDIASIVGQLQAIAANPATLLAQLQSFVTVQQSKVDTLTTQVSTDQSAAAGLNSQIATLQSTVAQQQTQINALTAQIAAAKSTTASPLDVAQSFKSVVDLIRQSAQTAGGVQTTVSAMNVQLKSLVSVAPATDSAPATANLVFPDPTSLPDPAHLSTLSFTFGAIPNLSAASVVPPAPGPGPAPASTASSPSVFAPPRPAGS